MLRYPIGFGPGPAMTVEGPNADTNGWRALGELYHRYLTGLILALVVRQGVDRAARVVYATFRR